MRFSRTFVALVGFVVLVELVLRLFGYGFYIIYQSNERLLGVPAPGFAYRSLASELLCFPLVTFS